jgi:4-amino-4-deoxy-L-arabinose transferase-like glycosyltransferase
VIVVGKLDHRATKWWLIVCVCVAAYTMLWGIRKDLPLNPETDESAFVAHAIRIAASGDLNPGWFGNPGSTIIYPLTMLYHLWVVATGEGDFFQPSLALLARLETLETNAPEFYLLGRLLSVAYGLFTVPLVYLLARKATDRQMGIAATWLFTLYTLPVFFAQWVRTDTSALFFGTAALWRLLCLYQSPTLRNQLFSGLVIGLAIASRYFMLSLIPVLVFTQLIIWFTVREPATHRKSILAGTALSLLAAGITFVATTPYFFLDFETAVQDLRHEARSTQLGHDGLTPPGNLAWYITEAIPQVMTWPQALLAASGFTLALWKRPGKVLIVAFYVACYLVLISLSSLHWDRWIIQLLPALAILTVYALQTICSILAEQKWLARHREWKLFFWGVLLFSLLPDANLLLEIV